MYVEGDLPLTVGGGNNNSNEGFGGWWGIIALIAVAAIFGRNGGLFSRVLAGVFDKAVTYKLENDLTI